MQQETKLALRCGANLRQVVTDILEKIEYVDTAGKHYDVTMQRERLCQAVEEIKQLLVDKGLFERVYPLEPFEHETVRQACVRTFGRWIVGETIDIEEK